MSYYLSDMFEHPMRAYHPKLLDKEHAGRWDFKWAKLLNGELAEKARSELKVKVILTVDGGFHQQMKEDPYRVAIIRLERAKPGYSETELHRELLARWILPALHHEIAPGVYDCDSEYGLRMLFDQDGGTVR